MTGETLNEQDALIDTTYQWAHILAFSGEWMAIPVLGEFVTVVLNIFKKEGVQKPDVVWVIPVEEVEPLKAGEKGPPASGEVPTTLKPQPLDPGIVRRPIGYEKPQAYPITG